MKTNISRANKILLENLFWIVPLNFVMIISMFIFSTAQRSKSIRNQEVMQKGIEIQIASDSIFKKNQDSLLGNTMELRNLIKK